MKLKDGWKNALKVGKRVELSPQYLESTRALKCDIKEDRLGLHYEAKAELNQWAVVLLACTSTDLSSGKTLTAYL